MTTVTIQSRFKAVYAQYPSGRREASLMDQNGNFVCFDKGYIYHPVGGMNACKQICEGEGLVTGSTYFASKPMRLVRANIYAVNVIPVETE